MYKVQVLKTEKEKPWYWRVLAANNKVILTSEMYSSRTRAKQQAYKFVDDLSSIGFDGIRTIVVEVDK